MYELKLVPFKAETFSATLQPSNFLWLITQAFGLGLVYVGPLAQGVSTYSRDGEGPEYWQKKGKIPTGTIRVAGPSTAPLAMKLQEAPLRMTVLL
jgi:hypothetical protein